MRVPTPQWPTWVTTLIFFFAILCMSITPEMVPNAMVYAWLRAIAFAMAAYNHQIAANNSPGGPPASNTATPGGGKP